MKTIRDEYPDTIETVGECWEWTGTRTAAGYGQTHRDGGRTYTHRLSLALNLGRPIDDRLLALHTCDNPPCANPDHLYEGTKSDNARDAVTRGLFVAARGSDHCRAKLTERDVYIFRWRHYIGGESQSSLAREAGVHSSVVSRALRGETWKSVPMPQEATSAIL